MSDRAYSKRQLRDVHTLVTRALIRGGDVDDALRKVEDRASLRAAGEVYSGDRKLDRRIARLAKQIRKERADA
jgi:hypothetical protein